MGATNLERSLDGKLSVQQVKQKFNEWYEDAVHEYGHDAYSGEWNGFRGIIFPNRTFESQQEASEYLDSHGQKFGPALAVKFKKSAVDPNKKPSQKVEKIKKMIDDAYKQKNDFEKSYQEALSARVTPNKNTFLKCKNCKSKINLVHFKGNSCPICHKDLRTPKFIAKLDSYKKKIEDLEKRKKELLNPPTGKKVEMWLIGGIVAE